MTTLHPILVAYSSCSWTNQIPPPPPSTRPSLPLSAPALGPMATTSTPNSSHLGMILSPAADPITYRLVQRIQSREFIEMQELLADNIALHNQTIELHGHASLASTPATLRPQVCEIPLSAPGCTVLLRIWQSELKTPKPEKCWPIPYL